MLLKNFQDTLTQLTSLGFTIGSEIWLKLSWDYEPELCPSHWPWRKDEPEAMVLSGVVEATDLALNRCLWSGYDRNGDSIWQPKKERYCFDQIAELAQAGATVHFYPTQPRGGISNRHVSRTSIVFYEIDQIDLENQWQQLFHLTYRTNLVPCSVIYTGGKSLHVYFRLNEAVESEVHWRRLVRKLCILQNGDTKVTNPARAMRLTGISRRHRKEGNWLLPVLITLEQWSRKKYAPTDFEAALDQTGEFPYGLSDERWVEWVSKRNQALKGKDVDPRSALTDPGVEAKFQERQIAASNPRSKGYNLDNTDTLVEDALKFIPQRSPGGNTYEVYRTLLIALKNYYGAEEAIALMENHSPSRQSGWNVRQVCHSSKANYGIGVFFHLAEQEFGWKRPKPVTIAPAMAPHLFKPQQELNELKIEADEELRQLLVSHDKQRIWEAITALKVTKKPIKNPTAWLKRAIHLGWKPKYPN